jgi:hypothetical protein
MAAVLLKDHRVLSSVYIGRIACRLRPPWPRVNIAMLGFLRPAIVPAIP